MGALMQLVAYGAQDVYLTGNPQITFWKVVYRRYTNFAMESIEQTFNGQVDFGKKVTCTVARNGDLIYHVYLQATLPAVTVPSNTSCFFRWVNYVGHALIKNVEVEIGGQRIDKHYGDWLNIWNELTQEPGHQVGYDNMVGNTLALTGAGLKAVEATTLYVPLQFWFCRNPGLALPLIALQYHEVRINLEFRPKNELYIISGPAGATCSVADCASGNTQNGVCVPPLEYASLYIDYVFLDTDERRRFAQMSHEYLIEQLQFTGDESVTSTNVKIKLNFNHPCKELVWVVQRDDVAQNWKQWSNYTDDVDTDGNVESGFAAESFPLLLSAQASQAAMNGAFGGPSGLVNNGQIYGLSEWGVGGSGALSVLAGLAEELGLPVAALSAALGLPFSGLAGPGVNASQFGAPVNFGVTDAGSGADHAGLGPVRAGRNPVVRAKLQLNGHDRFSERLGSYFNLVQPYQHHTNVPATGINVYSFALKPEDHQPSGTCNFSRIDSAVLQLQLTPKAAGQVTTANGYSGSASAGLGYQNFGSKVRVYATNYNVLRIMSGMGGLAYSN
jgi:hypothetical protein